MKIFSSFLFLTAYAAAQRATPAPADPNSVIRVETNVVLVDAVVTDKKGNYVRDLKQKDFKIYEDNKEQPIQSFSFEADPSSPLSKQPRYLVLFFDNSTMNFGDQTLARKAATKFIDANAGPNRQMAIVNYSGVLQVAQNFTSDAERLKAIVAGTKMAMGPSPNDPLNRLAGNFGVTNMILGVRELAKNLASIPGRKTLVLLSSGFKISPNEMPDVTATIAMCNRSNVAIYPIDVRGLVAGAANYAAPAGPSFFTSVSYSPQVGTGKGSAGSGGSAGGSGTSKGGSPSPSPSSGTGAGGKGSVANTGGGNTSRTVSPTTMAPRTMIIPKLPPSASVNQEIMYMLANGTGGFVIVDTNDLLGGMEKIAKEMNEFYLIGYRPPVAEVGRDACHLIHVKVDRGGTSVRARTGYCNTKSKDVLAQTTTEKTLENRASAPQAGNIAATMLTPYFFTGTNVARVNVAIEIPPASLRFDKDKGKLRSTINVLGIAYKEDGSVGARFSDAVKVDFDNENEAKIFQQRPYHYENQFDIASGKYNLKVVFNAGGESFGKLEQPLIVEAYDLKTFRVSPLALSTKIEKIGQADQKLETALLEDRTPLVAVGYQVIPTGSARFKTTDKAAMYFEIYEPALMEAEVPKLQLALQIRVYDAKGTLQSDSGGIRVAVPEKGGNPAIPYAAQVPVAALAPGIYKIEVLAIDSANRNFARTAYFEVL